MPDLNTPSPSSSPTSTPPSGSTPPPRPVPPPMPPVTNPATSPRPMTPTPPTTPSTIPAAPAAPQATSNTPVPSSSFTSSIRTLRSDTTSLNQGQTPSGIKLEKKADESSMAPSKPEAPKPAAPTSAPSSMNIDRAAQNLPIPPQIPTIKPPLTVPPTITPQSPAGPPVQPPIKPAPVSTPPTPPQPMTPPPSTPPAPAPKPLTIPQIPTTTPSALTVPTASRGIKPLYIILGIVLLAAIGASIWIYTTQNSTETSVSTTPTSTASATPQLSPLARIFGTLGTIDLSSDTDPSSALANTVQQTDMSTGDVRVFKIALGQEAISFDQFLTTFSINHPTDASNTTLRSNQWVYGLYGQSALPTPKNPNPPLMKKVFIVIQLSDPTSASTLMSQWDGSIIRDLAELLGYTPSANQKPMASDFYNGQAIRYSEAPNATSGIGYSIYGRYLVIGSSRDAFRKAFDLITAGSPATPTNQPASSANQ